MKRTSVVPVAWILVSGCGLEGNDPTFSRDVAPLVEAHCASCHQPGGIGPFPLLTYDDASSRADLLAAVTAARTMPPSPIDSSGACRTFRDARWMTDDEIDVFARWAKAGAPEGERATVQAPAPDLLDDADLVAEMPEPYTPKGSDAHPDDDYRCFLVPPMTAEDRYLEGFEVVPGDPAEVHHVLLFSVLGDDGERAVQALDDAEEGAGWSCFSTPFDDSTSFLAGWAPGKNTVRYPEGTGVFLAGSRPLVMQVHYNLLAGARPDLTAVKLKTVASVQAEAAVSPIAHTGLVLEPGMASVRTGTSISLIGLADDVLVHGVFPHMHTLGQTLRLDVAQLGSDDETCLVDVWQWDFHWQSMSIYDEPLVARASDVLRLECSYDTRSRDTPVTWGEGTQDEMCLVFVYVTRVGGGPIGELLP